VSASRVSNTPASRIVNKSYYPRVYARTGESQTVTYFRTRIVYSTMNVAPPDCGFSPRRVATPSFTE
jgi:hypothetical protein